MLARSLAHAHDPHPYLHPSYHLPHPHHPHHTHQSPPPTTPRKLIDFDGAVEIGRPVGTKDLSTAYTPPETARILADGDVVFRTRGAVPEEELLLAHPTFDGWAFGIISLAGIARRFPFQSDNRDRLRNNADRLKLAR